MWIIIISMCSAVTLVIVLVLCSCWKRKRQKDDWLGLDGMVTQKNPDENVNHLPSATPYSPQFVTNSVVFSIEENDSYQRPVVTSNTRRSLPDIPSEIQGRGDGVWEPNGDNSSELYATVEPYHNPAKRHTLPNGIDNRPSISQHSSISQADDAFSPYASVNYDKLNKTEEHPYAIVKPHSIQNIEQSESNLEEPTVRTCLLSTDRATTSQAPEPHAPPRSRRNSSSHSGSGADINAASAVAGGIAASQELPYMTPPIVPVTQPNFSGDSQDSSKGYTSISVREPLANILAQTKERSKPKSLDPHYSTVSDDSDEMYTTIPDPNNHEYTSGSETYAQIQPMAITVAVEVNPNPVPSAPTAISPKAVDEVEVPDTYEVAPQPPSVDSLKHISHSRQADADIFAASSSSSVLNLGSPKPEKRQANSPLPPPPSATSPDFLFPDGKHKNLDEMYAKVHKNRKKSDEIDKNTEKVNRKSTSSNSSNEERKIEPEIKVLRREHNYETLKKSPRKNSDPGYEKLKVKNDDQDESSEPGYASINGPDSLSIDPGYELLNQSLSSAGIYEELREEKQLRNKPSNSLKEPSLSTSIAGYSVINKQQKLNAKLLKESIVVDEPNYESMPNESDYKSGSETDPNYESVNQNDPNYESVKYLDINYERLTTDDDSSRTDSSKTDSQKYERKTSNSGYETVDSSNSSGEKVVDEPSYERLNDDKTDDSESSGYEKIEKRKDVDGGNGYETIKSDKKNDTDCQSDGEIDEIFQV